jgi:P-type Ca2+ transporter type 2C
MTETDGKTKTAESIESPWALEKEVILEKMAVDAEKGLDQAAVLAQRKKCGKNLLQAEPEKSILDIVVDQFKSLIVLLLVVSAVLSFVFGDLVEGLAIVAVILINAAIGFFTELRAVRSMEALKEMTRVTAKVRRDGKVHRINAKEIVLGDILILSGGDVITADIRLIEASKLQVNEAALTGESLPVDKSTSALSEEIPLAERANMAFKGTAVTRGAGEGVVIRIGMATELGHISALVQKAEEEATPLEKRLDSFGRKLIWVTLGLAALVAVAGIINGREIRLMLETAIALAVASIPEGLPIVATVALARGMHRMAKRNALINKLSSVETLGATSVIITDKTGTLTENQMTITDIALSAGDVAVDGEGLTTSGDFNWQDGEGSSDRQVLLDDLLRVGVFCNDASLTMEAGQVEESVGEPMEVALLVAGRKAGMTRQDLLADMPEAKQVAFDQDTKMMATVHKQPNGGFYYAVKGSPEAVMSAAQKLRTPQGEQDFSPSLKEIWEEKNEAIANRGLRVIALAEKSSDIKDAAPYEDLTFLGLVGLMDPPREEVRPAIRSCKMAGIRVIMATGDHGATAHEIAQSVGLIDTEDDGYRLGQDLKQLSDLSEEEKQAYVQTQVFARVTPEQKLSLINLHQQHGAIVAMTGDGINDAPALKKADIGVAMGQRGTQVAREAADMVLEDDFFGTIVAAVEQGRVIFNNIRKFVLYLLSCNISEIMVVTLASVLNLPLPILPLQILFLNLVTDVFPALALGMGKGDPKLMEDPPRASDEPIMTQRHWFSMGVYGVLIMIFVILGMLLSLHLFEFEAQRSTTISFLILAFAQLWHVFDMRKNHTSLFKNGVVRNRSVWMALVLCVLLLLAAVYVPFLSRLLSISTPGPMGWLIVLGGSLAPMFISQILKHFNLVE